MDGETSGGCVCDIEVELGSEVTDGVIGYEQTSCSMGSCKVKNVESE